MTYESYELLLQDVQEMKLEYKVIEKNRTTLRSIMYMEKKNIPLNYYETRDKKMNFKTVEKRSMNYIENKTEPLYFSTEQAFTDFSFSPHKKEIPFDMTAKNY